MISFLHTADVHIGKPYGRFPRDVALRLSQERISVLDRCVDQARTHSVNHILVAGDLFDSPSPDESLVLQALEVVSETPSITWWVIPGNHDPAASPVWDFVRSRNLSNFHILDRFEPVLMSPGFWIFPAPILGSSQDRDPTLFWSDFVVPKGDVPVGLAHGSVASFGSNPLDNVLNVENWKDQGLSCVALGDWHNPKTIDTGVFYAGTPEPDGFDSGGFVNLVTLDKKGVSTQQLSTAGVFWHDVVSTLPPDLRVDDVQRLVSSSRPSGRARQSVWRWRPTGRLSVFARQALEAAFEKETQGFLFAEIVWNDVTVDWADAREMDIPQGALGDAFEGLRQKHKETPDEVHERALSLFAQFLEETR